MIQQRPSLLKPERHKASLVGLPAINFALRSKTTLREDGPVGCCYLGRLSLQAPRTPHANEDA